jgi:hypothetical protein
LANLVNSLSAHTRHQKPGQHVDVLIYGLIRSRYWSAYNF